MSADIIKNGSVMSKPSTERIKPGVTLLSTSGGIWGGSQVFNESLCQFLGAKQIDATLATSNPNLYSCKTLQIAPNSNRLARVAVAFSLARLMRKNGQRAVILDDLSGLWLAPIFRMFRITVFAILHLELRRKDRWGFGHNWLNFHLLRLSAQFTEHLFSVGKWNVDQFPVPVEFIGNFVSKKFFQVKRNEKKKYDLGTLCRLEPEKNLGLFLHLVSNLNQRSTRPVTAVVVGEGTEKAALMELAEKLNLQRILSFVPWIERHQVPAMLDQIRCFAITSHHEGFATTLLESHARGVPALVTDSSGYGAEFVGGFDRPSGLVFAQSDVSVESFLDASLKIIHSHESYRKVCTLKAAQFSDTIVLGKIEKKLREHFDHA